MVFTCKLFRSRFKLYVQEKKNDKCEMAARVKVISYHTRHQVLCLVLKKYTFDSNILKNHMNVIAQNVQKDLRQSRRVVSFYFYFLFQVLTYFSHQRASSWVILVAQ